MDFEVKMPEKVRKKIFIEKKAANKVLLMFSDVKFLTER